MSLYSNSDMIPTRKGIGFSSTAHEEDVILDPCLEIERDNMNTAGEPYTPYFYFYLPIIHELGLLIPYLLFYALISFHTFFFILQKTWLGFPLMRREGV